MNQNIQSAICELNDNIDNFIKNNEQEIKTKMIKRNIQLPMSENLTEESYHEAEFSDYIRKGEYLLSKKSLNENKDEEGGYLIPAEITAKINEKMILLSPMRSVSRIIKISTNNLDILIDSNKTDAGWGGVSEERGETTSPEIKKVKIPVHELYAKPKASQKLLDDSQINVEDWLISRIAEKVASLENQAFINGNGKDKPTGFLNYDSTSNEMRDFGKLQHFSTGANGKFEDEESAVNILVDVVCSLKPVYVKNAKWIMSRSALAAIRKLKNKDGICIWQPSLRESSPPTLLGYPVIIDDDMPALKEGTESISIAFGDFYSGYQIVDRQGLKILRDPYTSKPFVEFYASKRIGGAVVDFDAIKLIKFGQD